MTDNRTAPVCEDCGHSHADRDERGRRFHVEDGRRFYSYVRCSATNSRGRRCGNWIRDRAEDWSYYGFGGSSEIVWAEIAQGRCRYHLEPADSADLFSGDVYDRRAARVLLGLDVWDDFEREEASKAFRRRFPDAVRDPWCD